MSEIEGAILRLTAERGAHKSICPSEAARALDAEHWRRLMPAVRAAAIALAQAGRIYIMRKGKPVDPTAFKGVYRLQITEDAAAAPRSDAPSRAGAAAFRDTHE